MLAWLTFISATLAATFQGRRAVQGWLYDQLDRREARRADLAGWSRGGVDTWSVRIAEPGSPAKTDAPEHAAAVTVTVCDKHGQPSPLQADRLPIPGGAWAHQQGPWPGRAGHPGPGRGGRRQARADPAPRVWPAGRRSRMA